ncbi:cation:proton antiporter [Tropicimonas sediminicola]|uniref:Transporter, CPA2 family n=1 Tax=Tropicimonas sediminicola TaxID=1031541 RepID=A0A239KQH6_9RHOB|nr:cation:proton antiporter [Tropicimonas sediminicola]SNT19444.1 transporter, CPA2 family [Tropicimonas sediminicola]
METAVTFITLGALFLAGLLADQIGRRTRLPRVSLLLGCGILVGSGGLDLLPDEVKALYEPLSIIALTMVAFLLGGALTLGNIREHGTVIIAISLTVVVATLLVVGAGLWLIGVPAGLAFVLAAVATATDPAATNDALDQSGETGGFAATLRGIVAIDDAWGLIAFSLVMVAVVQGTGATETGMVSGALREIAGSVALGLAVGLPAAALTGRLKPGEPSQSEALAIVFLTAGIAIRFELSYLIAGMTAGAIIVNAARHHERAFHEIEGFEWPFLVLFFILAGATLDLGALWQIGTLGLAYVALRVAARLAGGWVGAWLAGAPREQRPLMGLSLLPQAGVAVGMALVAAEAFPEWGETLTVLAVGTTVVFELAGPPATLWAARRANAPKGPTDT